MNKHGLQKKCDDELENINKEFHQVIEKKGHCYDRGEEEGGSTCDCAYFYKKYVDTKKHYTSLIEKQK